MVGLYAVTTIGKVRVGIFLHDFIEDDVVVIALLLPGVTTPLSRQEPQARPAQTFRRQHPEAEDPSTSDTALESAVPRKERRRCFIPFVARILVFFFPVRPRKG